VIGVGRSAARCRDAELRLRKLSQTGHVTYYIADLTQQVEVRRLAEAIRQLVAGAARPGLDGLVNNAGTFTYWLALTPEGFETQWALNHLAPLLPAAEAARGILFLLAEAAIQGSQQVYRKHGKPQSPSRQATDAAAAQRLWALSAQMCGCQA